MDSDPMRFFVMLLLYETRICSEPVRISNTSTTDLAQYHLEQKLIAGCHYCWSTGLTEREKYICNIIEVWRCIPTNAWRVKSAINFTYMWKRFLKSCATLHICQVLLKGNDSTVGLLLYLFVFETRKPELSHYVLSDYVNHFNFFIHQRLVTFW